MAATLADATRTLAAAAVSHLPGSNTQQPVGLTDVTKHQVPVLTGVTTIGGPSKALAAMSTSQQMCIDSVRRRWQNLQFRVGRDPRLPPGQRKQVVVLGTGWSAMNLIMRLDVAKYDVTVISPRNFFTFTPLLPSVCAGTLSPRSCLEPVRNKLIRGGKKVMDFYEAFATEIDDDKKVIRCKAASGEIFEVPFDYAIVAVGAETNTFGIPGVEENAFFLKEVSNAREIHKKLLDCFERATLPATSEEEKKRLLHFVMVGGGPTGVETAAEVKMIGTSNDLCDWDNDRWRTLSKRMQSVTSPTSFPM